MCDCMIQGIVILRYFGVIDILKCNSLLSLSVFSEGVLF